MIHSLPHSNTLMDSGYYNNERRDVASLVPGSAITILDVGCGSGKLGRYLKSLVPTRVVMGIEFNPAVAAEARAVLDAVVVGDVAVLELPFEAGYFDCLICADILEHLVDPWTVLRKLKPLLKHDGILLCSIPNIRHYTAFLRLAVHGWEYTDYGLFDRTHLRFFSLRTMDQLLAQAGYRVFRREPRIIASMKMKILNTLCFGHLEEFLTLQYILLARPVP